MIIFGDLLVYEKDLYIEKEQFFILFFFLFFGGVIGDDIE